MCIGAPMQIVESRGDHALCTDRGAVHDVDIRLTPDARSGDWLLVFLGAARRTITAEEAAAIADALAALDAVGQGETLDTFFGDLTAREPQLPEHMETARRKGAANV